MLNYVLPGFLITIGNQNFTYCLDRNNGLTIRRPIAEPSNPYGWQCNFNLAIPDNAALMPVSIIKAENPAFWSTGQKVQLFFFNKLFATLYITRYSYSEQDRIGQCECADATIFFNYRTPAKDYKGLKFPACSSTTVNTLAAKVFNELGIPSSVNVGGAIDVPPNKPNGSWIAFLQSYLGERGAWLYASPEGIVRSALYPLYNKSPKMYRSLMDIDRYQPVSTGDIPHTKILATCSVEKFAKCGTEKDPEPTEEYQLIDGASGGKVNALSARTTITREITNNTIKTKTVIEQALGVIDSTAYKGSKSEIISQIIKETKTYDAQGREIEVRITTDKCLCLALPEQFPGETKIYRAEESIEKSLEYNPEETIIGNTADGVMRARIKKVYARFAKGTEAVKKTGLGNPKDAFPSLTHFMDIKEKVIELWSDGNKALQSINGTTSSNQEKCGCNEYKYTKRVYKQENFSVPAKTEKYTEDKPFWKLTGLQPQSKLPDEENSIPPEFKTKKPNCPTCTATFSTEVSFAFPGSSIYQKPNEVSANTLQTVQELQYYAQLVGTLEHQRYESRTISMPLPIEYMTNPLPFMVVAVHDGLYIVDSPSIVLGEDGAEFTFVGNRCGYIGAIQPKPKTPIIYLPIYQGTLDNPQTNPPINIYPIADVTANIDTYLTPINITVYGGQLPYSVTVSGLPEGLYYDNQIQGTPTEIGDATIDVTAVDGTGASASISFGLSVIDNVIEVELISQPIIPIVGNLGIEPFIPLSIGDEPYYEITAELMASSQISIPLVFNLFIGSLLGFAEAPSNLLILGELESNAPIYQPLPFYDTANLTIGAFILDIILESIQFVLDSDMASVEFYPEQPQLFGDVGFVFQEIYPVSVLPQLTLQTIIQEV